MIRSIVNNSDINVIGNSGATTHHINNVSIHRNNLEYECLLDVLHDNYKGGLLT